VGDADKNLKSYSIKKTLMEKLKLNVNKKLECKYFEHNILIWPLSLHCGCTAYEDRCDVCWQSRFASVSHSITQVMAIEFALWMHSI
jgi:hypothetical protein